MDKKQFYAFIDAMVSMFIYSSQPTFENFQIGPFDEILFSPKYLEYQWSRAASFYIGTFEQSRGRQEPLNCPCERLLAFKASQLKFPLLIL